MRVALLFSTALIAISVIGGNADKPSQAIQLQDGTVYFAHPPRLVETATTFNDVRVWGATYYFTVSLPEDAGEPLQRITIHQREGVDNIRYDFQNSFAFEGTRSRKQQRLQLKDATSNQKTRTVSLTFAPPVSPGKTITIALKPWQNPSFEGVYLFGVTAFPTGEKSHGQFLGFGRLHFYSRGFNRFGFPYGW
ncbi:Protein of unknown function (DUF2808) [Cylindrospermum stagnale PCC 7417]|uniref:DUF2808 domain-containing protein n=1 Tax=Cylindrospermum stagnale PCC 7417 TaxID=56107 RepID=K9WT68_9NOST|nr:DUF2808 domain-containing protein [Cylindrospermum stagnale]AFZ22976.1 Protein of unknown function (DUF2808) [Cylindrospermum stagnale PCC 7417]